MLQGLMTWIKICGVTSVEDAEQDGHLDRAGGIIGLIRIDENLLPCFEIVDGYRNCLPLLL